MAINRFTAADNEALASLIDFLTTHGIPFQGNAPVSSFMDIDCCLVQLRYNPDFH